MLENADRWWLALEAFRVAAKKDRDDLKRQLEERLRTFEFDSRDDLEHALSYLRRYQEALKSLAASDPLRPYVSGLLEKYGITPVTNPNNIYATSPLRIVTGLAT